MNENQVDPVGNINRGVPKFFDDVHDTLTSIQDTNLVNEETAKYNLYNYKKYKVYNSVLYIIIITCLIVLTLTFLRKRITYFDDKAYLITVGISVGLSLCYIFYILWDLFFRDNNNFDEYNFSNYGTKPQTVPVNSSNNLDGSLSQTDKKCSNKKYGIFSYF
jgi:hypothetical protein